VQKSCGIKLLFVLVLAFVASLLAMKYCLKKVNVDQVDKTKKIVAGTVRDPKQIIVVNANDCQIKKFDYIDQRKLLFQDLRGTEVSAAPKKVFLRRNSLEDINLNFRLNGAPGHAGAFNIVDIKGRIAKIYPSYMVFFDQNGNSDIVAFFRKGQVTTIYQEAPKLFTFYEIKQIK